MQSKGRLSAILFLLSFLTISLIGEDLNNLINQAKTSLKNGDAKKSAEMLNHILTGMKAEIRNHPRHAETWYYFSVALDRLGRKELAAKALDRAKKLKQMHSEKKAEAKNEAAKQPAKPTENKRPEPKVEDQATVASTGNSAYSLASIKNEAAQNFYRKGAAYLEQGQFQAAADHFIKACEMEPGNFELLEKTCSTLDQIGGSYYIKAQKFYAELAKHDKMTAAQKAAQARANIFSSKADLEKAETILKQLLKEDDKNVEAMVLSAQIDTERKKYKDAIGKFEKAIKLDQNNMPAYLGLGHCYLQMANFEKAIEVLSKARNIWPDSFKPLVALGKAYLNNNNLGSALQMFNTAFMISENDFEVNLGLLEIYVRSNDPRATQHLEICEKVFKGDPRVEFFKANYLELDEKILQARKIYSWLAMYDDATSIKARVRLGQLYSGNGHLSFPGNVLVKNRPNYVSNYKRMADYRLAFNYYQEAMDKNKNLAEAVEIQNWLNENEERISEAYQFDALIQSHFRQ